MNTRKIDITVYYRNKRITEEDAIAILDETARRTRQIVPGVTFTGKDLFEGRVQEAIESFMADPYEECGWADGMTIFVEL